MLDEVYEDIIKVHEDHGIMEMGKEKGIITKKEFITYELKRIKTAKTIAMIQSYELSCVLLLLFVLIEIIFEEYEVSKSDRV